MLLVLIRLGSDPSGGSPSPKIGARFSDSVPRSVARRQAPHPQRSCRILFQDPGPEIVHFWGRNGRLPVNDHGKGWGGFAHHPFPLVFVREGPLRTPRIDDLRLRGPLGLPEEPAFEKERARSDRKSPILETSSNDPRPNPETKKTRKRTMCCTVFAPTL